MAHDFNVHDKRNYFLSTKSTVWFQKKLANGTLGPLLPIGDIETVNFTSAIEKLTHSTNIRGLNAKDLDITTLVGGNVTVEFHEVVRHNLEFLLGSSGRVANQTIQVPLLEKKTFALDPVNTLNVNGGAAINSVIDVVPESGELDHDVSTDYSVTPASGLVTREVAGNIPDGATVIVYYDIEHTDASKYPIFDQTDIRCKMFVVSDGIKQGPRRYIEFPDCDVSIEGDINLNPKTELGIATLNFSINEDEIEGFGNWYHYG